VTVGIKLSICIPAYNRPDWLRRAIASILASGITESIEIIVSDDSTDDRCEQVVQEVLRTWAGKWHYGANRPGLGMAKNWNRSIRLATGTYVLILHDDDFLYPSAVTDILTNVKKHDKEVFLFGVRVVDERERVLKTQARVGYLPPREALRAVLSNSSLVRFPAIVVRRSVFAEVGYFDASVGEPADLEMWTRLFSRYGVMCVPSITSAYTVHSRALTMGMFSEGTVKKLLVIFDRVPSLLSEEELGECRASFFHQFLLAGAFRMVRRGKWREFREVMGLFELEELRELPWPAKWWFFRWGFGILVRF
jgi:glycosyltransferase involved in cell wall biosynthesis